MIEEEDKIVGNIGKEVKEMDGSSRLLEIVCCMLEKLESDLNGHFKTFNHLNKCNLYFTLI